MPRTYVVQPGDSPASIAARDDMAGCPRCSIDLVREPGNAHKPTVTMPNGFVTFRELRIGEVLVLPEKWFSKEFDELPPSYFASLPHPDGVTPSKSNHGVGVGIANPASTNCIAKGGKSTIVTNQDGSQSGYCVFPDGTRCEEWAFYRGTCSTTNSDPAVNKAVGEIIGGAGQAGASAGAKAGIVAGIAVVVVGGVIYIATRKRERRRTA